MKLIGSNIAVREIKAEQNVAGIVISESAKKETIKGEVIAVGPGQFALNGTDRMAMTVEVGDIIVMNRYNGTPITDNDEEFIVLDQSHVLVILNK